jgi:large subunit ribosomal protein L18
MAKLSLFERRRQRVRTSLRKRGGDRPRLSIHRSGRHIYAQVIDDAPAAPLLPPRRSTRTSGKTGATVESAQDVGRRVAERAKAAGVTRWFSTVAVFCSTAA